MHFFTMGDAAYFPFPARIHRDENPHISTQELDLLPNINIVWSKIIHAHVLILHVG